MKSEHLKKSKKPRAPWIQPQDLARELQASVDLDHGVIRFDPQSQRDLLTMARWGRPWGLFEGDVRASRLAKGEPVDPRPRLPDAEIAEWIRTDMQLLDGAFDIGVLPGGLWAYSL